MIKLQRKLLRIVLIFTSTLGTLLLHSCSQSISYKDGILVDEFIYDTATFASPHASTIAETPNGIVVAFFGGTYERNPDVCIYICRLENGQWTPPLEVANGVMNDTLRYPTWNPVLYQIPNGDLQLYYKIGPNPAEWWGMLISSNDNGKTWSSAKALPDGIFGPIKNKPVLLANGNLLSPSSTENNGWQVHLEMSPDFGKTWSKTKPLNNTRVYEVIQPTILQHNDSKLQILCRSHNAVIAESWSNDNGKTWSLFQASALPNNNSGIDGVTLHDGRQLLVYNHMKTPIGAQKGYRTPLNVAISNDGKNWDAALILEDDELGKYSYPSVIQSADGFVHIVYTWRRQKIKYVKVDVSKLKTKNIINEVWPE